MRVPVLNYYTPPPLHFSVAAHANSAHPTVSAHSGSMQGMDASCNPSFIVIYFALGVLLRVLVRVLLDVLLDVLVGVLLCETPETWV